MTKKSRQKLKYLENEKSFKGQLKSIFHHFLMALSCQQLSQILECSFKVLELENEIRSRFIWNNM